MVSKTKFGLKAAALVALSAGMFGGIPVFGAQDGVWQYAGPSTGSFLPNENDGNNQRPSFFWKSGRVPKEGGIARFPVRPSAAVNQNVDGLVLGGIECTAAGTHSFAGKPIRFTGDAVLRVTGGDVAARIMFTDMSLTGETGDTLAFAGYGATAGSVTLAGTTLTGFDRVTLAGGEVTVTGSATAVTTARARLAGGRLLVVADAEHAACDFATVGGLELGPGANTIALNRDSASAASVTFGAITRDEGATLILVPQHGLAALGDTERFFCATPPTAVNGLMPAWIVARDLSTQMTHFLAYDAERGFVLATYGDALASGVSQPTKIAKVEGVQSDEKPQIAADTSVFGLWLRNAKMLSFANGAKLTIGDGVNPAGLVVDLAPKSVSGAESFSGSGEIAFGTSPATIYFRRSPEVRELQLNVPVSASNGLTFRSEDDDVLALVTLGAAFKIAGDVHVQGVKIRTSKAANLPTAPIYVEGNGRRRGGQLVFTDNLTCTNELHLSGFGGGWPPDSPSLYGHGALGTFNQGSRIYAACTGTVTLEDDTGVDLGLGNANGNSGLMFNGKVTGPGRMYAFTQGTGAFLEFYNAANDWTGGLCVTNCGDTVARVKLGDTGTLGSGDVLLCGNAPLELQRGRRTFAQNFSGTGMLEVSGGTNDFTGTAEFSSVTLMTNATLGVGTLVTKALVLPVGSVVRAAKDGAELKVAAAGDVAIDGKLADGEGGLKLGLVQAGTGTLSMRGRQTYTGPTVVKAGTLRLDDDYLGELPRASEIVCWLDATRKDTLTFAQDDDTKVTHWASANGNGVVYGPAGTIPASTAHPRFGGNDYGAPTYLPEGWNGKPVLAFTTNMLDRLLANRSVTYRTVFFATRTDKIWYYSGGTGYGGLWGQNNADFGMRLTSASSWENGPQNHLFNSETWINGVKTANVPGDKAGTPQVLTAIHSTGRNFIASLGGYIVGSQTVNPYKPYGGEVGEMIAYDCKLTETERKQVEDYLNRKWRGATVWNVVPDRQVLDAASSIRLEAGATLDLNGATQIVARLEGEGAIVNTSAGAARLVVTDASAFRGSVSGNVDLALVGGGSAQLSISGAASFGTSASLSLAPYNPGLPLDGLLYWLDVSWEKTVTYDAETKRVTAWRSREGEVVFNAGTHGGPVYCADGLDTGKPALAWPGDVPNTTPNLVANASTVTRTLFIVFKPDGALPDSSPSGGIWGRGENTDRGIRFRNNEATSVQVRGGGAHFAMNDLVRQNGVESSGVGTDIGVNDSVQVVVCRVDPDYYLDTPAGYNVIGAYQRNNPRPMKGFISEVIAYDRSLEMDEVLKIETYLLAKWRTGTPETPNTAVFQSGCDSMLTVDFTVAPDGSSEPVVLTGVSDLTRVALGVTGLEYLARERRTPALQVTGPATGEPVLAPLGKQWSWFRHNGTWYLLGYRGTTIVFR